jgi:gas vesicle protein
MSDHDSFGSFLVGFIVGGLTGAVVALLFAPQSGEQTRTLIKEKSIELYDMAENSVEDVYKQAQETANESVVQAQKLLNEAKDRAAKLQQQGQVVLEEQKAKVVEKVKKADKSAGAAAE